MSNIINMPESVEIAIYSLVLIADSGEGKTLNVDTLAKRIQASPHHLHKILQILAKKGFIKSRKGPGGGYIIKREPASISLLDIYESIEGPISETTCPLNRVTCPFDRCIYNGLFTKMKNDFKDYFKKTKISIFTGGKYGSKIQ
ncbi:Rrf2 family transcriptional regulator [bacterium]|nr:Rrf2 family transcriptional regulator [bacterium]